MKAEAYRIMDDCEESYWWYRVRRELIVDAVRRFVPPGSAILDFGCGTGATSARLVEWGYRVSVTDVADAALDACRRRGLTIVAPEAFADVDFRFDCALACDVLEHVEDDTALLRDLRNVIRPGGLVLVTVPAYEFLWSGEDYVSAHVRRYTRRGLEYVLRAAGFDLEWRSHFNTILFPAVAATILGKRLFRPRDMYRSNIEHLPVWLDEVLGRLFALERPWLKHFPLPFGTSAIVVARRPQVDRHAE